MGQRVTVTAKYRTSKSRKSKGTAVHKPNAARKKK